MRCPACRAEVGSARRCPHCQTDIHGATQEERTVRGTFRGRMDGAAQTRRSLLGTLSRFFADPHTPPRSKWLLAFAILYIISPLDFLPGGLIPVIGWFDDIIIAVLTWLFIGPDLKRHHWS